MTTTPAHCRNLSFCAFTYIKTVHSNKMKEHLAHSLHRDKHGIIAKPLKHFKVQHDIFVAAAVVLVSFAAVIKVVTQCSSPTNGCSLELCIPFLKLTNKEQASISWKPGPLAANVTRNMIGAAAYSYMHVVGSQ